MGVDQTTQDSLSECRSNQTPTRWLINPPSCFPFEDLSIHLFLISCRYGFRSFEYIIDKGVPPVNHGILW
jgi:hypothetical protein